MSSREESGEAAIAVRNALEAGAKMTLCGPLQEDFLEVAIRERATLIVVTTKLSTCRTRKMTT